MISPEQRRQAALIRFRLIGLQVGDRLISIGYPFIPIEKFSCTVVKILPEFNEFHFMIDDKYCVVGDRSKIYAAALDSRAFRFIPV